MKFNLGAYLRTVLFLTLISTLMSVSEYPAAETFLGCIVLGCLVGRIDPIFERKQEGTDDPQV